MSLAGVLGMGRTMARSRMRETWQVGDYVESSDPVTLDPITVLIPVYEGPGRFKAPRTSVNATEAGGQIVSSTSPELHLPSGTTGVEVNMVAVCTGSPDDASLVGLTLRIDGPPAAGQTTAARYPVKDYIEVIDDGES